MQKFHVKARTRKLGWQSIAVFILTIIISLLTRLKTSGKNYIPTSGFILAPNHISYFDAIFLGIILKRKISFMGKSELFETKHGKWLSRLGGFPVKRGAWDTDAFDTATEVLNKGNVMVMFLEGGINPQTDTMKPAKAGIGFLAQETGVPVVPCWLDGTRKFYKPWTWPKVHIKFGPSLQFSRHDVSKESCQETANVIREHILYLKDK